jgi:RimJ/RimL family protein N-acetyltransferase
VPASLFTPAQSRPDTESRPDTVRVPIFFETERLRVRRFTDADVDAFVSYRADPDVARYQSWSDYTLEQGRALVESMREAEPGKPGDWFQLAVEARASGTLVGDLALHVDGDEPRQAEVGFTLDPAQQGRGYATEALGAFLDWIFPTFGLHRVIAVTDALNAPAARLLERAGLRREAHFVDNVFFKGAWGSEFLYAVLDRERGPRT